MGEIDRRVGAWGQHVECLAVPAERISSELTVPITATRRDSPCPSLHQKYVADPHPVDTRDETQSNERLFNEPNEMTA